MDAISSVSQATEIKSVYPAGDLHIGEVDLDELFGFNEVLRREEEKPEECILSYFPHRIFINHCDCFNGKYLVKVLSRKLFQERSTVQDTEGEEEQEEEKLEEVGQDEKQENKKAGFEENEDDGDLETDADIKDILDDTELMSREQVEEEEEEEDIRTETSEDVEDEQLFELDEEEAFYAEYDVSKLTVQEYSEVLEIDSDTERRKCIKEMLTKKLHVSSEKKIIPEQKEVAVQVTKKFKFPQSNYEFVGTLKYPVDKCPENVLEIITSENKEEFTNELMKCGVIIYDISRDATQIEDAKWAVNSILNALSELEQKNKQEFKNSPEVRIFILISSIMTWAMTKPLDPDDPDLPFTDGDYHKRRAHPNYKSHLNLEKEVLKLGKKYKDKFKTIVIASAVLYGWEEDVLHYLFKLGWHNKETLPIIGSGKNLIPLLHVEDLGLIIDSIISNFPDQNSRYIFATEQTTSTLKEIVKAISEILTTGRTEIVSKEKAILMNEIPQPVFDLMTVNLNIEPSFIRDEIALNWKYETGFVDNINAVVNEYKEARKLKPLWIFIHGPPGSGKTRLSVKLAEYYKLDHLQINDVIQDYFKNLKNKLQAVLNKEQEQKEIKLEEKVESTLEKGDEEEEDEEEEDMQESVEMLKEKLEDIENNLQDNNNRLNDERVIKIFKEHLLSHQCQNQGYILDGFPKTLGQVQALFGQSEKDEENTEEEQGISLVQNKIMPEFIINLEASDGFLLNTILSCPEYQIQGTHYDESGMVRRLSEFRKQNREDNTLLNFFDDTINVNVERTDPDLSLINTFRHITELIGRPRNYEHFAVDAEAVMKELIRKKEQEFEKLKKKEADKKIIEETLIQKCKEKMKKWATMVDSLKEQEEQLLAIQSKPLRNYLIKYVFPTLTRGLIEVADVHPENPVDYLAEYLFKENPQGRMFHPEHTREADELFKNLNMFGNLLGIDSKMHLA